jgi:hypothetical protein
VLKESKNFVWLENDRKEKIKVSKKTQRVWVINESVIYETAKCNILEPVA